MPDADGEGRFQASELAGGVGIAVSGRSIGRGLGFLNQLILARLLGPQVFGLYSIGWSLLRALTLLAPLGMESAVVRFGAVHWPDDRSRIRKLLSRTLGVGLISGIAFGATICLTSDWLALSVFHKPAMGAVFRFLGPAVPFAVLLKILASSTSVTRRLQFMMLGEEIAQPLLQLAAFVILFFTQVPRINAAMVAVLLSVALAAGLTGGFAARLLGPASGTRAAASESLGRLLAFSVPVALGGFLGSFLLWADRLLIGALGTESDAGIYAIVSLVSVVFTTLLSGFKSSLAPMAAALQGSENREALARSFRLSTRWSQYLAVPVFLFLVSSGKDLLSLGLGGEYEAGYVPMMILCVGQLLNACTGPVDTLLIMGGHPRRWTALAGLGLAGLVLLSLLWIPRWGLLGAALASAAIVTGVSVASLAVVRARMRLSPFDRRTARVLVAGLVTMAVLVILQRLSIPWSTLRLASNAVVSVGVFLAVIVYGGLPSDDLAAARALRDQAQARWSRLRGAG